VAETSSDDGHRNNKHSRQQVPDMMSAAVEENALRDAIYRSSRCGWTNSSRQQQPQQLTDTVYTD